MRPQGVTEEQIKLRAFPFSLADQAKDWLFPTFGIRHNLERPKRRFLEKYFPASRATTIRKEISGIRQFAGESLFEYWGRFNELVKSCPHHQIPDHLLIQYYEGLSTVWTRYDDHQGEVTRRIFRTAAKEYDPFSNTYNPGWKDHPNLSYGAQSQNFQRPQYRPPMPPPSNPKQVEKNCKKTQTKMALSAGTLRRENQKKRLRYHKNKMTRPRRTILKVLVTRPPFPERFAKSKKDEEAKEILETFRKVEVNIPLLDAIKQIPRYARFLKELCTSKARDRSVVYPEGVLEDVLVQVNELVFPADFYVLDMREDNSPSSTSILLGRPFLKTARTKIDVHNGTLSMEFDGEIIKFNIYDYEAPALELKELPKHLKIPSNSSGPADQDKTTFTCPFGTFAYRRMPFGLCNAPATFQRSLKYLLSKKEAKPRLIRWILLLQEFDLTIKDKKGAENLVADHLSRLVTNNDPSPLNDEFPDEHLHIVRGITPWYADLVNFLVTGTLPRDLPRARKDKIRSEAKYFVWDDPYLWKFCSDQLIRRDAYSFCKSCENCQKVGNINPRNQMPLSPILVCEVFDVWGIDFILASLTFILGVDYVSKWVEAKATRTDDAKTVVEFVKANIFSRFGMPRAIISDRGTHFCNKVVDALLKKYNVTHRVSTAYHPKQMAKPRFPIERSSPYSKDVEIKSLTTQKVFKVNGHRLKPFYEDFQGPSMERIQHGTHHHLSHHQSLAKDVKEKRCMGGNP
ncbi:UNVERIFIED_CONTAM: hypothetical protein Scaly_2233300 [Sesamum calycinum]|uniref:Integrase catalytic domain-containing protein n=1 Tax=Sesamum calycinum TaxID=2727403 RepID=A0AAW2M930_9LAMI